MRLLGAGVRCSRIPAIVAIGSSHRREPGARTTMTQGASRAVLALALLLLAASSAAAGDRVAAATASPGWRRIAAASGGPWQVVQAGPAATVRAAHGAGIPWLAGYGNALPARPASDQLALAEQKAREFIEREHDLLGARGFELSLNRRLSGPLGTPAAAWYLQFDASAFSVPIEGAQVSFFVNNGNLVAFSVELPPHPPRRPPPGPRAASAAVAQPRIAGVEAPSWEGAERKWRWTGSAYEMVWVGIVRGRTSEPARRVVVAEKDGVLRRSESLRVHARAMGGVQLRSPQEAETLLPLANLSLSDGVSDATTDAAGRFTLAGSPVAGDLSGPFVTVVDSCGSPFTAASGPDLQFGSTADWDCATPFPGAPGNTAASRTGSYHVNRIRDLYRSYDSLTAWLDGSAEVRTNFQSECANYFDGPNVIVVNWNGGSQVCSNAGVNPDLLYHEWGHAYQWNQQIAFWDAASREGYADVTGLLQIHDHCLGRGFYLPPYNSGEGGSSCSGYREMDYTLLNPALPARPGNIASPPYNCQQVQDPGSRGIAGFQGHCESHIMSQAVYELAQALAVKYGPATGWNKLLRWWIATGTFRRYAWRVVSSPPLVGDGCDPHNWYMALRFVADDNGNLADGVPDGEAIFAAFDRHGIACAPGPGEVLESSACAPLAAPTLTLAPRPQDDAVALHWSPVAGARGYEILRSDLGPNGAFTRIAVVDAGASSHLDRDGTSLALHWYAVATLGDGSCRSALSPVVRSSDCVPAIDLSAPRDAAVVGDPTVEFAWTQSQVASSYELLVGVDGALSPVAQVASPSAEVAATFFEPGAAYDWQVAANGLAPSCAPAESPTHTFQRAGQPVAPLVTSLEPAQGPVAGGTEVRLRGSNLFLGSTVLFGGVPAAETLHVSPSELIAVTPANFPGPAEVTLRTPGGQVVVAGSFAFLPGPSTVELLVNGGMEIDDNLDAMPDGWQGFANPAIRRRCRGNTVVDPHSGRCVARLRGQDGQTLSIKQVRTRVAGVAGDRVLVGAWLRGVSLPDDAVVKLKILLVRRGRTIANRTFRPMPAEGEYSRVVRSIQAPEPYDKVVVRILYEGSGGTLFVDDVAAARL